MATKIPQHLERGDYGYVHRLSAVLLYTVVSDCARESRQGNVVRRWFWVKPCDGDGMVIAGTAPRMIEAHELRKRKA